MGFHTYEPPAPLGRFVELLWSYADTGLAHRLERVLPDGAAELVINLDDVPRKRFDRDHPAKFQAVRNAWISGPQPEYMLIDVLPRADMIGARFRPGGLAAFLPMPIAEVSGQLVEADALWGRDLASLRGAIAEEPALAKRFGVLEDFLRRRIRWPIERHSAIREAVRLLERSSARIEDVAARLGLSQKHFIHCFRAEVGLTPKRFHRIRRFQQALGEIQARRQVDWSDLAYTCGFYDQAHLIHEFRAFSGLTPNGYLTQPDADARFVPITDQR